MSFKDDVSGDVLRDRDFSSGLGEVGRSTDSTVPGCEKQPGLGSHMNELVDQLYDTDLEIRLQAATQLAGEADSRDLPLLLKGTTHIDPAVRHATLVLIRDLNRRANQCRDADLRVALEAEQVINAIAHCLRDENPLNVLAANVALNCIATPAAKNALKQWRYEKGETGPLVE
jgi:hypothetical protein